MTKESYKAGHGRSAHRRSLYTYWKRLAPNPQLATFDTPTRELCTVRRDRTNTPLQALRRGKRPAVRRGRATPRRYSAIAAAPDPAGRLDYMSERLLARPLRRTRKRHPAQERGGLRRPLHKEARRRRATHEARRRHPAGNARARAPEQAAWTMVASEFLNLDETLNK